LHHVSQRRWRVREQNRSDRELPQHCGNMPRNAGKDTAKDVVLALANRQEGIRRVRAFVAGFAGAHLLVGHAK